MSTEAFNLIKRHAFDSVYHKVVMLILADYANDMWETWVGQPRLAAESNISERKVRGVLSDLEAAGLISRRLRHRGEGRGRTSDLTQLRPAAIAALPPATTNRHSMPDKDAAGPVDNSTTIRHSVPDEQRPTGTPGTTNRHARYDQPAQRAGEPSENPQRSQPYEVEGWDLSTRTPEVSTDHFHEFVVIDGPPGREYRACRHCGVSPAGARGLGADA